MSKGILILASNTDDVDYVSMAKSTAERASDVLQIPNTVIDLGEIHEKNMRQNLDNDSMVQWNNKNRFTVIDYTPYDVTLVIDSDFIVNTRNFLNIFNLEFDYLLSKNFTTVGDDIDNNINKTGLKYLWATAFVFRRTKTTQLFFKLVRRIQSNWEYYRMLYNIEARNFRNDIAFTLADSILHGYNISKNVLPYSLTHVTVPNVSIQPYDDFGFVVRGEGRRPVIIPKVDLHVLSKSFFTTQEFKDLLNVKP